MNLLDKFYLLFILFISLFGAPISLNADKVEHSDESIVYLTKEQIKDLQIETRIANRGELSVSLSARGKIVLHPDKLTHILPKISGVAVAANKNIGDIVHEGDVLAVLESLEMADIKANYLAAKEKAALSLSLMEREKRLYEKKISSEQEYLNAKSAYAEAGIEMQLSRQKLKAFGIEDEEIKKLINEDEVNLRLYEIKAPMNGNVLLRHINKGEFIESNSLIYEIADLSVVFVEMGIYPKDLVKVKKNQLVDVSFSADESVTQAKIIYLSPIIQDETITAKAIAELKNPDGNFRPGTFVKVNIVIDNAVEEVLVPKDAIQEIDGKEYVFIKIPEGFEKREVKTGLSNNDSVQILSGLNQGEEYAATHTFILKADLSKHEADEHR